MAGGGATRVLRAIPRFMVGILLAAAVGVMLSGVFLRYVMLPVTAALGLPTINFFWVQETGELLLAWLTLIGAAIGIAEHSHFVLDALVQHLPPKARAVIYGIDMLLIAAFGGLLAWQGWKLAMLNRDLSSPALGISLGWLYGSAVAGGALIVLYAIGELGTSWRGTGRPAS
jgi:TRAP-type C4-dicarboxylate transport system permease small subunit